jgi:hypothetical protein
MPFASEGSPNTAAQQDLSNRVACPPSDNFMLAYHPDEWMLDARGRLIPVLVQLSKAPGVCGVTADGSFRAAKAAYEERGWVLLPHDVLDGQDYVALYRNRKGARVHRTVFQYGYNDATGTTKWGVDRKAYEAFITFLRRRGFIKQPRPQIVAGLLEATRETLKNKRQPRTDDHSKVEAYNEQCEILRTQIATLEAELATSIETYGAEEAPARGRVLHLLESLAADDDAAEQDAPAAQPAPKLVKPARTRKGALVADDGGPEDNS